MRQHRYVTALVVFLLVVINLVWVSIFTDFSQHNTDKISGDAAYYYEMSVDPSSAVPNPYVFRRMSSEIVYYLNNTFSLGLSFSWGLITYMAALGTQIVFYFLLKKGLGIQSIYAFIATVMLASTRWFTIFHYSNIWLVEPLNTFFVVAAIYALIRRKWGWFLSCLLIGALNKEVVLLLLPLYPAAVYLTTSDKDRLRVFVRSILFIVLVVVAYVLYRNAVVANIDPNRMINPLIGTNQSFVDNIRQVVMPVRQIYGDVVETFGFMWAVLFYVVYKAYARDGLANTLVLATVYLFAVLTLLTFVITDVPRAYALLAPFVMMAGAIVMQQAKLDLMTCLIIVGAFQVANLGWFGADRAWPAVLGFGALLLLSQALKGQHITIPKQLELKDVL